MSQPIDPWSHLRHQAEDTRRLLENRSRRRERRITTRNRRGEGAL